MCAIFFNPIPLLLLTAGHDRLLNKKKTIGECYFNTHLAGIGLIYCMVFTLNLSNPRRIGLKKSIAEEKNDFGNQHPKLWVIDWLHIWFLVVDTGKCPIFDECYRSTYGFLKPFLCKQEQLIS